MARVSWLISYVGFKTIEYTLNASNTVAIILAPESSQLSDVVVVGYGTQKKVTVTGAVAMVKGSELAKSPALNLSNSLAGRLPGVTTVNASGEPGYDGSSHPYQGYQFTG